MKPKQKARVAVAMSGGVDSLRTAALLKQQGNDVFGIHMRLFDDSNRRFESSLLSISQRKENLRILCNKLRIPLVVIDLRKEFRNHVIEPFLDAYRRGLTPNPCVLCNPTIKFGYLLNEAKRRGADYLATGHYARLAPPDERSNRFRLYRALDIGKDQSYFLFGLSQNQMASALFPLGNLLKKDILDWADQHGLTPLLPEESQELCFIRSQKYHEFLMKELRLSSSASRGPILDMEGTYLAEHKGVFAYTIGQRRGLGIASHAPYYVVELNPKTNTVRVGRAKDLYRSELRVEKVNWVSIAPPKDPFYGQVRIRNQHTPAPAEIIPLDDSTALVRFETPQRAVTPGQAAVIYDGDVLLGGGLIEKSGMK